MADLMKLWQERFDAAFPNGVRMSEPAPEGADAEGSTWQPNAPVAAKRVTVTSMSTPFSPEILLDMSMGMYGMDFRGTVETYVVMQESPCTIARVTFVDGREYMLSGCGRVDDGREQ